MKKLALVISALIFPLGVMASISSSAASTAVVQFTPAAWSKTPVPTAISGIGNIQGVAGSGGLVSWAIGTVSATNQSWVMSLNTGNGWGVAIPIPVTAGLSGLQFIPAYPQTGAQNTGWALAPNQAQTSYFDGNNFEALDAQTFNGDAPLALMASGGNGWAITGSLKASYFNKGNNTWSAPQALPLKPSSSLYAAAADGSIMYILGVSANSSPGTGTYSLVSIDNQGNIQNLSNLPANQQGAPASLYITTAHFTGKVLAEGSNLFVFMITDGGKDIINAYAYYSEDNGQTWIDLSKSLPPIDDIFIINNLIDDIYMTKGVVSIPPCYSTLGPPVNGVYFNFNQPQLGLQAYPLPANFINMNTTLLISSISADGDQQCIVNEDIGSAEIPITDCYDFTKQQWLNLPALEQDISLVNEVIALGGSQVVALGRSSSGSQQVTLYYDGSNWSETVPGSLLSAKFNSNTQPYNVNNIWAWGLDFAPGTK